MVSHEYLLVLDPLFESMRMAGCFITKKSLINMNQLRIIRVSTGKTPAYPGGIETVVWNIC